MEYVETGVLTCLCLWSYINSFLTHVRSSFVVTPSAIGYALRRPGQRETTRLETKRRVPKADREGLTIYMHSLELARSATGAP
jgi:hypothetical protein